MSGTRADRAEALERSADDVDSADLKVADTQALSAIAELVK